MSPLQKRTSTTSVVSDSCLPCKKRKRSPKSVNFSPRVNFRCLLVDTSHPQQDALSLSREEVGKNKARAKALSQLHLHLRTSKTRTKGTSSIGEATRYKLMGDSLRGCEFMTDVVTARKRRRVRDESMRAVKTEQQEQLVEQVLNTYATSTSATLDQVQRSVTGLDTSKLAQVYREKSKHSLVYAKKVAQEDAAVAAKILTEDLAGGAFISKKSPVPSQSNPRMAAEIIKSLLPNTLSRQFSIVSMQA